MLSMKDELMYTCMQSFTPKTYPHTGMQVHIHESSMHIYVYITCASACACACVCACVHDREKQKGYQDGCLLLQCGLQCLMLLQCVLQCQGIACVLQGVLHCV